MVLLNCRLCLILASLLVLGFAAPVLGQVEDPFGDHAADPVKLFERGQGYHSRRDFERALEFYEQAIKVRPEFPEAEFQRGNALVSLGRFEEGEVAFRQAIQLRKEWSLPYAALGALLLRLERESDAETALRQALKHDEKNGVAARLLADIRLRAGDPRQALELALLATDEGEVPASAWIVRAMAERAVGDKAAAKSSIDRALQSEPDNIAALIERAELHLVAGELSEAIRDLTKAARLRPDDKHVASRLAFAHEKSGNIEEAQRIALAAGLLKEIPKTEDGAATVVGTPDEIEAANSDDPAIARKALEGLLQKNQNNPTLLAKLGASYRIDDPARSLEYYRRAVEIEPANPDLATGYAGALVKARRFEEAVVILRRVIAVSPDNYAAHSNLATALYSLKRFGEALSEYEWLMRARPDLAVIHYFIATAHDNLGEYQDALGAYETFLAQADVSSNQLEIEKVKLRLPTLRRQVQLKEGVKRRRQ
ncbi:MAG TPA: tetratricopeptide repeat protein [Pyrinomonadaceae bacterium]|nr:tetratricopeptide repeat protein [Pyrinomonadaceae bacterium]